MINLRIGTLARFGRSSMHQQCRAVSSAAEAVTTNTDTNTTTTNSGSTRSASGRRSRPPRHTSTDSSTHSGVGNGQRYAPAAPPPLQNGTFFRALLKTAVAVERDAALPTAGTSPLQAYISRRYREVAARNHDQKLELMRRASATQQQKRASSHSRRNTHHNHNGESSAHLQQWRAHVDHQHAMIAEYRVALMAAPENSALASVLTALAAGVGSPVYQRTLEKGFFDLVKFREELQARGEADAGADNDRQNKILVAAILPFLEKLAIMHDHCDQAAKEADAFNNDDDMNHNDDDDGHRNSKYQKKNRSVSHHHDALRNALSSTKAGTSVHVLAFGSEEAVLEIDDELNRQVIYVRSSADPFALEERRERLARIQRARRRAMMRKGSPASAATTNDDALNGGHDNEDEGPDTVSLRSRRRSATAAENEGDEDAADDFEDTQERVTVAESDLVRATVAHAGWLGLASRLYDALSNETAIHRSRSTVVVGHHVGGAVAVLLALHLHAGGYTVKNVITFGAPRCVQDTLQRFVAAINPIRVVLGGDPIPEGPLTTSEGKDFMHLGEGLTVSPPLHRDEEQDPKMADNEDDEEIVEGEYPSSSSSPRQHPHRSRAFSDTDETVSAPEQERRGQHNKAQAQHQHSASATNTNNNISDAEDDDAAGFDVADYLRVLSDPDADLLYEDADLDE